MQKEANFEKITKFSMQIPEFVDIREPVVPKSAVSLVRNLLEHEPINFEPFYKAKADFDAWKAANLKGLVEFGYNQTRSVQEQKNELAIAKY